MSVSSIRSATLLDGMIDLLGVLVIVGTCDFQSTNCGIAGQPLTFNASTLISPASCRLGPTCSQVRGNGNLW
jgi:hypothetical protein